MMVQVGDAHDVFEIDVIVNAVIGTFPFGLQEVVPLLPYPDGVRFDARQAFYIFYGKAVQGKVYVY